MKHPSPHFGIQLFILFITACLFACNNHEATTIEKASTSATPVQSLVFDKLSGTWRNIDGKSFEQWTKKESGGYQAVGFTVMLNDTSWNERADIYQENGNWIFENTVKGQNDGKAVKFTSSFINDTAVQFSNPAHDFPTDVNYTIADINTLRAFIIGPGKNGWDTIPFNYVRVK